MNEADKKEISSNMNYFRIISLAGILLFSLFLNLCNNDFPLGYHIDEPKKIYFVLSGKQDFHLPILMLNSVRLASYFLHYKDPQRVVELGRKISAIMGTLICLAFFLIISGLIPNPYDLMATFALASTPILVIHSHYLKEDIYLTCFTMFSLLAYFSLVRAPQKYNVLLLGFFSSLALSSHYKGALLIPLFFMGPFIHQIRNRWQVLLRIFYAIPIVLLFFLAVDYQIFGDFSSFLGGLEYDFHRIQEGHGPKIYPLPHYFCFHLLNSILPGLTIPLAIISLFALLFFLFKWNQLCFEDKFFILFLGVFYCAVEISPMKPAPGALRYILPLIPLLVYFAFKGFYFLEQNITRFSFKVLFRVILSLAVLFSIQRSIRLTYHLNRDTRERAEKLVKAHGQKVFFSIFGGREETGIACAEGARKLRKKGYRYVVVSSFYYKMFAYGTQLNGQPEHVFRWNGHFQEFFSYPYVEIKPEYMSYAFSNPTLRIVDIRGDSP
ncbi:ArnT family glycosyltransferase [Candidatus Riflebacteria bacterium]